MHKFLVTAATAALLAGSGAVCAATYNLGTLDKTIGQSSIQIEGSFDDTFNFTTGPTPSTVLGSLIGIDVYGDFSIKYRFGEGSSPTWGAWSSLSGVPSDPDTGTFSYMQTLDGLHLSSQYWFQLQGTASQAAYSITLAPVPEPQTYSLLLVGLSLMGAIARRRRVTGKFGE